MKTSRLPLLSLALVAALAAPAASASQLIARDGRDVRLQVNASGKALVTYRSRGAVRRVLAWGAVNATPAGAGRPQVTFRLDYSGGWRSARRPVWKGFENNCRPASVPLVWAVAACRAADGSLWALQRWQRTLPVYGVTPTPAQAAWELRLSHWTGPLPRLEVRFGWTYRRYHQLYGRLMYRGLPVYGLRSTSRGRPLDTYGRNIYVDTFGSAYGSGWRRENGFLTHEPTGGFCYGFYPHGNRPSGQSRRYRATVIGPGVTPDVYWQGLPPPRYNPQFDLAADSDLLALLVGDRLCRPR